MEQRKDYFSSLREKKLPKSLYLEIANYFGPNKIIVIVTTRNPRRRLKYAEAGDVNRGHGEVIRRATNMVHDVKGVS